MKNLKKLLFIAFLGIFSLSSSATECTCSNSPIFQGLNVPFNYGLSYADFNGGFNFSTCGNGAVTFTWDYGDGNTYSHSVNGNTNGSNYYTYATTSNHTYAAGGTYNVCLTITYSYQHPQPGGGTDVCTTTNCETITVDHPCDGNVTDFHTLNYSDSRKRFIDISRANESSRIVSQTWNIEGQVFSGKFVEYIFSESGTYDVCLEVIYIDDETGQCCIQEICNTVVINTITEACDLDPDFSFSCFSDDCIFKFSGSAGNSNRNIKSWSWDFGDGRTGKGQNVYHTYEDPGTYEVCLTIVGDNGGSCCYEEYCREIEFDCNGIDLLSLPSCDNGSQGGGGAATRTRAPQLETANSLAVYPNPSSNIVNLEIDTDTDQRVRVELIDINGKKIPLMENLSITKGQTKNELNIGDVATGVYTLTVTGDTFYKTKVLVIE